MSPFPKNDLDFLSSSDMTKWGDFFSHFDLSEGIPKFEICNRESLS